MCPVRTQSSSERRHYLQDKGQCRQRRGGATWGTITGALEDQADLYDTLFNRVRYADTASMLSKYLRKTDAASLSNRINLKLNASDTASLSSRINLKLNSSDTASLSARINAKMDSATAFTDYSSTSTIAGFRVSPLNKYSI